MPESLKAIPNKKEPLVSRKVIDIERVHKAEDGRTYVNVTVINVGIGLPLLVTAPVMAALERADRIVRRILKGEQVPPEVPKAVVPPVPVTRPAPVKRRTPARPAKRVAA
jgi:hypothetical protein